MSLSHNADSSAAISMRDAWLFQRSWFLTGLLLAWFAIALIGMIAIWWYETSPGTPAVAPAHWPTGTQLTRATDRHTLLLFAHPKCPCTKATLEELARLSQAYGDRLSVQVMFFRPSLDDADWMNTALCQQARAIPNVRVEFDTQGTEALRFGVTTSGQALLYNAAGQLQFAGGITNARGQTGPSTGQSVIASLLSGRSEVAERSQVFGCPLRSPDDHTVGGMPCPTP